jgi:hypothetical protein
LYGVPSLVVAGIDIRAVLYEQLGDLRLFVFARDDQ